MASIVLKFGGPAIASTERIQEVAKIAMAKKERGYDVVVVTAAMGRTAKDLTKMVRALSDDASKREMDVLLSTSSQLSSALFAIALQEAS